jgi:hypothetical protein
MPGSRELNRGREAAEPGRADLAQDLAISLLATARLDSRATEPLIRRAIEILQPLAAEKRLDAKGTRLLEAARRSLAALVHPSP